MPKLSRRSTRTHDEFKVDAHVGERIKLLRETRRISQTELADECGITFQQIQKYESGHNRVSASRLVQIAEKLERPVSYFFEGLPAHPVSDLTSNNDSMELVRLFQRLDSEQRANLLTLMQSMRPVYDKAA